MPERILRESEMLERHSPEPGITRRAVLEGTAGACAALALPSASRAQAAPNLDVAQVADGLALISGAGGNILVRSTSEGHVVVDSGAADHGDALLATLAELPGADRVAILFNTHWHLDQVGSNAALGRGGAAIVAHAKTRAHLATDYYLPLEDRYEKALPAAGHPTETFYTKGITSVGGHAIEYGHLLQAHTDGDIFVYFRDANVLAVGDAVSPARDPVLDWFGGGWLGGRVDSLALVLETSNADTRFVPSYGPVIGRAAVQAEHDLMLVLFERMVERVRLGESAEQILAAGIMDDLDRRFDDPFKFIYDAHKGLWAHHNTLSPDVV